jgi:hypothetical protein
MLKKSFQRSEPTGFDRFLNKKNLSRSDTGLGGWEKF